MKDFYFAKTKEDAKLPVQTLENAGLDIYACFDEPFIKIESLETKLIPTGIASAFPPEYYIQIQERGSTGSKGIKYGAGVIDSGYRGEWFIAITNANSKPLYIAKSPECIFGLETDCIVYPYEKAIAQAIIHKTHKVDITEISFEELQSMKSERGDGKLGSSGN